jgi:hypothetical protein
MNFGSLVGSFTGQQTRVEVHAATDSTLRMRATTAATAAHRWTEVVAMRAAAGSK